MASLRLGDTAPDFTQHSSAVGIHFHQWLGDSSARVKRVVASVMLLKDEFAKRHVKAIALSVDPVDSHEKWISDINRTQATVVNFPIIAEADRKVSELYDLIHPNASITATVRSLTDPVPATDAAAQQVSGSVSPFTIAGHRTPGFSLVFP